ncbi:MAG: hypothetical protein AB1630_10425, partial [bacterium]
MKKILLLVFAFFSSLSYSAQWPFKPQNSTHPIGLGGDYGGNYGKYQYYPKSEEKNPYFHSGIDIPKKEGTEVLSCSNGYIWTVPPATATGAYLDITVSDHYKPTEDEGWRYTHTRNFKDQNGVEWKPDKKVSLGDRLCEITYFRKDAHHLHFGRDKLKEIDGKRYSLDSIRNPLDLLNPNTDNISPTIEDVKYSRNKKVGDNYVYFKEDKPLWGDVDIIAKAYDERSSDRQNPYKMSYQITHNSRDGFKPETEFYLWEFDTILPGDNEINDVYRSDSVCRSEEILDGEGFVNFWYIVTNTFADSNYCWDTNTKDDTSDATKNGEAKYPDGRIGFLVKGYDIYNKSSKFTSVILDNFAPYVKKVKITQAGKTVYDPEKGINKALKDGEVIFNIQFSEEMDITKQAKASFAKTSPYEQHNLIKIGWKKTTYDNDTYQAKFTIPKGKAEDYDGTNTLKVKAYDLAGNELNKKIPISPPKKNKATSMPGTRDDEGNWVGYEPGEDTNNKFQIDLTPPKIKKAEILKGEKDIVGNITYTTLVYSKDYETNQITSEPMVGEGSLFVKITFDEEMDRGIPLNVSFTGSNHPVSFLSWSNTNTTWYGEFVIPRNSEYQGTHTLSISDATDLAGNTFDSDPTTEQPDPDTSNQFYVFLPDIAYTQWVPVPDSTHKQGSTHLLNIESKESIMLTGGWAPQFFPDGE